ncbi:hypothetical protein GGX14DRAFT_556638 [Mycena pura]|uniref:C2 domain-containing protein n=1 Tax=Mycena pura TaxID=153505 RepID=A0AAD6YQ17_9AGAR|nr:hypothetical protein GGX14DRAFT_556638 [Mycena pura]
MPSTPDDPALLNLQDEPQIAQDPFETMGVVKVIIQSAHIDTRNEWWWSRPPNPFVVVQVDVARATTSTQAATYDPSWLTQAFCLLVKSPKEDVKMMVYNSHRHRKYRSLLGAASFSMSNLTESRMSLDVQLSLLKARRRAGDLSCSFFYYPISMSSEIDAGIGIARLTVHWAEELQQVSIKPMAQIRLGWDAPPIHVTPRRKNAVWESTHEFLCFNMTTCVVYIDVVDPGPKLDDPLIGHVCICLMDLVEATKAKRGRWALSGCSTGKLVASAQWRKLSDQASDTIGL